MYSNPYMQPQYGRYLDQQPQYPTQNNTQYAQNLPQTQPINNQYMQKIGIQGKTVESIDVVKAIDIPLDGTVSYFPLADGSAIVTKQLQNDGTSKTIVYKPNVEESVEVKYLTKSDLDKILREFSSEDIEDIKEDLKELRKEIKGLKGKEK